MEVLDERDGNIANAEVIQFVRNAQKQESTGRRGRQGKDLQNLYTMDKELRMYLEKAPCSNDTVEQFAMFYEQIKDIGLYKIEVLMILNNHPRNIVELTCLIDQIDARLTPEEQEQLVEIINEIFPPKDEEEEWI